MTLYEGLEAHIHTLEVRIRLAEQDADAALGVARAVSYALTTQHGLAPREPPATVAEIIGFDRCPLCHAQFASTNEKLTHYRDGCAPKPTAAAPRFDGLDLLLIFESAVGIGLLAAWWIG